MIEKKQKIRRLILGFAVLALVVYLAIKIIKGFDDNAKALADRLPSDYSLTVKDSGLFAIGQWPNLKVNEVLRSKSRNSISLITFDRKYSLILYKIGSIGDGPLKDLIVAREQKTDHSTGYSYGIVNNNYFSFQYKAGSPEVVTKIFLTLSGDSIHTFSINENAVSYHLLCSSFSVKYSDNGPVDLYIEANQRDFETVRVPMDILFLKRHGDIYFLMMVPNDVESSAPPNLVYTIIRDN